MPLYHYPCSSVMVGYTAVPLSCVTRIINQATKKFFLKIDQEQKDNDTVIKILASDGKNVWESTKIYWNDLINLKPDGIDEPIQSASISLALLGSKSSNDQCELKEEDLVVDLSETGSGNLNISWKLKQMLGITIVLGAVILLKLSESDASLKLIELLEQSALASKLSNQLKESLDFNKKLLEEYEKVVRDKVACEEELFTKFRILLDKINKN